MSGEQKTTPGRKRQGRRASNDPVGLGSQITQDITDEALDGFIRQLYTNTMSDDDLMLLYSQYKYQGFDRKSTLKSLMAIMNQDIQLISEIVLLCVVQGPKRASTTVMSNGRTPQSMGITASGLKGRKGVSCARISTSLADLGASYLKRVSVPKRLPAHPLPGWLQFPSAGSIRLPDELRELHRDFSVKFSSMIGGEFNEHIYHQMEMNAYLDSSLNLFGDI